MSTVKEKLEDLKRENAVEEVRIVGISSVHIDCDLDQSIWHGTNLSVNSKPATIR